LLGLLTQLENSDERARLETVQHLGSYKVQRSVSALSAMALHDPDSAVRSGAVSSLGAIDHPSVFAFVLIALGDESREVRAAAARTLTSLHFDRADAYNRVIETASAEILKAVASSCVKAGIAAQAIHRLTSEDRRQAYEAFSLMTLLAKADETQPILDVIENFGDNEIRLCAVRVLNVAGQADVVPKLRELVASDRMPEELRTAVLEVLYKFDQQQPVFEQVASQ
jgi:HEAT repeat protein